MGRTDDIHIREDIHTEFYTHTHTGRTIQVVVLLAVRVGEGVQLPQQQGVLEDPLDGLDQVGLQGGRVLLSGVPLRQEGLELGVCLSWTRQDTSRHRAMRNQVLWVFSTTMTGFQQVLSILSSATTVDLVLCRTFSQDLGHLGVAGTEGAVDLEAVSVVQEGATQ